MKRLLKTYYKNLLLILVVIIPFALFNSCAKEKQVVAVDHDLPVTIILYNKPLATIKQYAQGSWKYVYGRGGFGANTIHRCDNCYIEITPDDKIIQRSPSHTDTLSIVWKKELGSYIPTYDSTFVMNCYYQGSQIPSPSYIVDKIVNDTLVIHDYASDPIFYHYIKSKKIISY